MTPLTLGLISGGVSVLGNLFGGMSEKEAIEKRNKRLAEQQSKIEREYAKEKEEATSRQRGLATDFLTNYITIRDKDRAEGLRGEYNRSQSEFANALTRLMSEKNQLTASLEGMKQDAPSTGSVIGQSLMTGIGSGLQGYGTGQQLSAANKLNSMLDNRIVNPNLILYPGDQYDAKSKLKKFNPLDSGTISFT